MTVQLERIEWGEFRWDEADKTDMPRVLLIGDSITKGYRPHVAEEFKGIASIDLMASSRGLDNPAFARELRYVTVESGYNYRVIQFNNGLHGFHSSAEAYEAGLDRVLTSLMKLREDGGAKIVLALSTPVTRKQEAGSRYPPSGAECAGAGTQRGDEAACGEKRIACERFVRADARASRIPSAGRLPL